MHLQFASAPSRMDPYRLSFFGGGLMGPSGTIRAYKDFDVAFISNIRYVADSTEQSKMTLPAFARELRGRLPSASEKATANQLRKLLAAQSADEVKLLVPDSDTKKPTEVVLTPAISGLLMDLLRYIGSGDAVTLVPVSKMLTTQQAADVLNVSRPFLISLLEKKELEHTTVGRHRRIRADHLFDYKRSRDEKRSKALSKLAELDAEQL